MRYLALYDMNRATDAERAAFLGKVGQEMSEPLMRALVVYCHPREGSFTAAVRDLVMQKLNALGAEVRLIDLYAQNFDPILTAKEHEGYEACPTTAPWSHNMSKTFVGAIR